MVSGSFFKPYVWQVYKIWAFDSANPLEKGCKNDLTHNKAPEQRVLFLLTTILRPERLKQTTNHPKISRESYLSGIFSD